MLHLPPLLPTDTHGDAGLFCEMEDHRRSMWREKGVFRNADGSVYYGDLGESKTMDDLCRSLRDKDAVFYADVGDSREIVVLGLQDAEVALQKNLIEELGVASLRR